MILHSRTDSLNASAPIDIVCCLHDSHGDSRYLKSLAAQFVSIRQRTCEKLHLYIVHDESTNLADLKRLVSMVQLTDRVTPISVDDFPTIREASQRIATERHSPAVAWRMFLPDLLESSGVDKVLSVDADLIHLADVRRLWNVEGTEWEIGAVRRGLPYPSEYLTLIATESNRYFRLGVTLMNLARMRNNSRFMSERLEFAETRLPLINAVMNLPDQSLFNYFFSATCIELPCCIVPVNLLTGQEPMPWDERLTRLDGVILDVKGWQNDSPFAMYYWSALLHTPWKEDADRAFAPMRPSSTPVARVLKKTRRIGQIVRNFFRVRVANHIS